jgi:hypothetical protein
MRAEAEWTRPAEITVPAVAFETSAAKASKGAARAARDHLQRIKRINEAAATGYAL